MLSASSSTFNNMTAECTTPNATQVAVFTFSNSTTEDFLTVLASVLMTILGTTLLVLGLLGRFSGRQRAHSTPTRIFLRASFALFLPLMSYMFSQANNEKAEPRAQIIVLWMLLIELIRKKVYTMVAPDSHAFSRGVARYTFFDTVEQVASFAWIGYLMYSYVHGVAVKSLFIILWIFSVVKLCQRFICIERAKRSFDVGKNAALVSSYIAQLVEKKHLHMVDDLGADRVNIMRTCNYVVMGEGDLSREKTPSGYWLKYLNDILTSRSVIEAKDDAKNLVRVCTIWELAEQDPLFRYNDKYRRKVEDICLGLALFKLLRRRFERFPMPEAGILQARDLVLRGLLALEGVNEVDDAERAFDVAELEITYLDEYYQATIPLALPSPVLFMANFVFSIVFIMAYCITVLLVTGNGDIFHVLGSLFRGLIGLPTNMAVQFRCLRHQVSFLINMVLSSSVLIVTFLLTVTLFAIEMYELFLYLQSDWFVASLLCEYARNPSLREQRGFRRIVWALLWMKVRTRPRIKAHQVAILRLQPQKIWALLSRLLKRRLVGLPPAVVTTEAKVAIIRSIKDSADRDHFSNGRDSLYRNGYQRLTWACDGHDSVRDGESSVVEIILVWHVATSLFETGDRAKHPLPPNGRAAVTLSKYCAYLVAYMPALMPDNPTWTNKVFKDLRRQLRRFFQSCHTPVSRRDRLLQLHSGEGQTSLMMMGAKLGKQLEEEVRENTKMQDEERVWRVLADFWAEMLVFVARKPSEGADAHALALASGGEFITHIWSMLTHAGLDVRKHDHQQALSAWPSNSNA